MKSDQQRQTSLAELAFLFLRLGLTAFGGPAAHIALMREEVVRRRQWMNDERFVDLIGITNLIPGPSSTELAIYLGYLQAGWPGLLVAGICFIGPAMLMVLVIAWAYVAFGTLPQVNWLFYGLQPVVVAIVAYAIWNLGRTIFKHILAAVLAVLILVLYLLGVNVLILLFGGAALYGVLRLLQMRWKHTSSPVMILFLPTLPLHVLSVRGMIFPALVTGLLATSAPVSLFVLFLTFLKLGAIVYGSGYTLLAFLHADLVQNLHWLTDKQLLDAVSIGQFTPGPVFTTVTFIGYLLAGFPGAILATVGIFLPSFALIAAIHPIATRLRKATWTATLLDGINAAALALMTGVLVQLGQHALVDVLTWVIALIAFIILVRWKINSVWLIMVGAMVGVLRFWLLGG